MGCRQRQGTRARVDRIAGWRKFGTWQVLHCLADSVERNWDHVFPESWYPQTTPSNLEKWKIPSCIRCNSALGMMEDRLLIQLAHALDPDHPGSAGIYDKG